jgi:ADP-ribosyl-[dinitrogen reductase] hydrolase
MSPHLLNSQTHPLRIASVPAGRGGLIGVTFCPGKHQPEGASGAWARDLIIDLDAIHAWGAAAVVTLITPEEMRWLRVPALGIEVCARGMAWFQLPIQDGSTPDANWERGWGEISPKLHEILYGGGRLLIHCKGGLGRAGLVAARLLIEAGASADKAIAMVRTARPGAVETHAQEDYLRALG